MGNIEKINNTDERFQALLGSFLRGRSSNEATVSHLDQDTLTISSEKKEELSLEKNGLFTKREFSYQSFQRSFTIPERLVDADKIAAKYENGILHIALPKRDEAKPRPSKMIDIS